MSVDSNIHFMRHALSLARRGLGRVWPNPAVGCVIVKNGVVIGRGRTADGGRPHAEVIALAQAGKNVKGATAYVSLEPCAHHGQTPPCAGALLTAGLKRVVVACTDPDPRTSGEGLRQLQAGGVEVTHGVLEADAQILNEGFFLRVMQNRPEVTLKLAISTDNKISWGNKEKKWISGDLSRRYAHLERAKHDAILVGIGTVLADDPVLTTRLPGANHKIIRIVLDRQLRLPVRSKLAQSAQDDVWVFYESDPNGNLGALELAGVRCFACDPSDLKAVLAVLAEAGITRLLAEGGAKVATSFLEAGLCDRFLLFKAPVTIGGQGLPALAGRRIEDIGADFNLKHTETRALGQDLLEIYSRSA